MRRDQAIELAGQAEPELILLDALMPGLDGFETCSRIKANPATRSIPVIFMTALTEAQFRIRASAWAPWTT